MNEKEPEQAPDTGTETVAAASTAQDTGASAQAGEKKEEEKVPFDLLGIEDKEGCVAEMRVRVPWEAYEKRFEEIFADLKKTALVDGFRRGKAPIPLLKARYRDEVRDDVLQNMIPNIVEQIEAAQNLKTATDPTLVDHQIEDGQPLQLTISAQVFREVTIVEDDVKGLSARVEVEPVTDDDVAAAIEQDRLEAAVIEPVAEDAAFAKGFILTGQATPLDAEGREIGPTQDSVQIDSESPHCDDELMALLDGRKVGDTVVIPRQNDEGRRDPAAGAMRLHITALKKRVKPTLDDEFAKDLGYDSLEAYRAQVRSRLEAERRRAAERKAVDQIVHQVAEKKNVQVPPAAVAQMARQDFVRLIGHIRPSRDEAAGLLETLERAAEFNLKRRAVLDGFRRFYQLEATEEDLNQRIEQMAREQGRKPLAIRAKLEAEKRLDELKEDILLERVTRKILEAAAG